jgi:MFS family permease
MKNIKKILFTSLGAGFEYYDFAIYLVFATAIGAKFFDSSSQFYNTIMVFSVFVIGYVVRPFGAILFGYIGDKYSRIAVLRITMLMIFLSTLGMAILPGVETLGITATIIFVLLRTLQGVAVGAEIPISVTYLTENFPKRQGLMASMIFACLSFGIFLTSVVLFVMNEFTSATFIQDYGWRIGFILGAVFTLVVYMLRKNIKDDDYFIEHKDIEKEDKFIVTKKIIISTMLMAAIAMMTMQILMFLPTYCKEYIAGGFDIAPVLLIGSFVMMISCVIGGFISDYVCKKKMLTALLLVFLVLVPILYRNLIEGRDIWAVFIILSVALGFIAPTYSVIIVNLFKPSYKCRGMGISYNFGYLLFSSPMPAITMLLIGYTANMFVPVYMITGAIIISLVAIVLLNTKSMRTA